MDKVLEILKQFLPVEIAVIAAISVYLLLLFKEVAERFITIAEKQTSLAETQTQYIQQRLDVVEKFLGISNKAIELRDKHIEELEELANRREAEIARSRESLDNATEQLQVMEHRYQQALFSLGVKSQQLERLHAAQRRLEQASRAEATAQLTYKLQTRLQVVLANVENVLLELPSLPTKELQTSIQTILNNLEGLASIVVDEFQSELLVSEEHNETDN